MMSKAYDSERETRVLLEELQSQLRVIAEGHTQVIERLDEHDLRFDQLEERFDKRFNRMEHHFNRRFDRLEEQFGGVLKDHERRIVSLERNPIPLLNI